MSMEKYFCFTVDDNIRFLGEICEANMKSIFEHPYLNMLERLHHLFDVKVQLNLFYRSERFDLSMMTDAYREEWRSCSDWLKLSFHSDFENVCPYKNSDYREVYEDCNKVNREILRFASSESLAKTTTVHYCQTTKEGLKALSDNGVKGLLGLFGTDAKPETSYCLSMEDSRKIRNGELVIADGITFSGIDIVLNAFSIDDIRKKLSALDYRTGIRIMIHEQYFYSDYRAYQPDFEEKLRVAFEYLCKNDYKSVFFEDFVKGTFGNILGASDVG